MDWVQCLSKAINYIENHLTEDININEVSNQSYSSSSHFQLIFHLVMGLTVGEYIRNRRLSSAAQDLLQSNNKIIDIAMKYQYDTQESFSKAFTRFHGVPPSKANKENIKLFNPLTINISIQGGFVMSHNIIEKFCWNDIEKKENTELTALEKYNKLVSWAGKARSQNPGVFDSLTEWILDDSQWSDNKLVENEQILIHGVLARFKEQNKQLRIYLKELQDSGVVNEAVFNALDSFDAALSGELNDSWLSETITKVFADFSIMRESKVREKVAGNKTGATGTDSVDVFGYINYLEDCDASVQWTLFMPDVVEQLQKGFKVESFEYKTMLAMRFIGIEDSTFHSETAEEYYVKKKTGLKAMTKTLDAMTEYKSGFDHDILFQHHYGKGVDVEPWHGFWGRFMKADTPVPEGFVHWDFVQDDNNTPYLTFRSQFAFATFSGDVEAMHNDEGTDGGRLYDVTRNIILGQGVIIPYPEIYWTADVFLEGCDKDSTAFLFSVLL